VRNRLGRARLVLALGLTSLVTASLAPTVAPAVSPASAATTASQQSERGRFVDYRQWAGARRLESGFFHDVRVARGKLRLAGPTREGTYDDPHGKPTKRYQYGTWKSRWTQSDFGFTELVGSWDARTPRDTWIQVRVRGRSETGKRTRWFTLGRWAEGDERFHRTSVDGQSGTLAEVVTDTLRTRYSVRFTAYQMQVTLFRRAGTRATPWVRMVGAMTSRLPQVATVRTSAPGVASGLPPLDVPRYSQMLHEGDYPEYDGGGEAWCSPTSVSMVLGYYGRLPAREDFAWVERQHPNRFVDHAARMTYDYQYEGAGNWSFNTAYAGTRVHHAFVTRMRSLREAERFIRKGIPVVVSISFGRGELDRAPISSTAGHLLVIVGFTEDGDVVVNDPAAPRNRGVRRVYDRGQFENAWLPKSGGLAYVIRTLEHPMPAPRRASNW
jgi:hypothetical protein